MESTIASQKEQIEYLRNQLDKAMSNLDKVTNSYVDNLKEDRNRAYTQDRVIHDEMKEKNRLINNAGFLADKSLSTIQILSKHMNDAPRLEPLESYRHLITNEGNEEYKVGDIIVYYHRKGALHEYLGNIIIDEYKKDNPKIQSIWNSDTSRLTYFIRDIVGEDRKMEWITDKKGVKVKEKVIMPLLNHVRDELRIYSMQLGELTDMEPAKFDRMRDSATIIHMIGSKKDSSILANKINQFIAGHFYLDKKNAMKEIE